MPPSQLKRLKASLREQGITGPQKSKKQKKKGSTPEQRVQRNAALSNIRDSLNPFDVKSLSRPQKFESFGNKLAIGPLAKSMVGRPGVSKSMGEEARKKTLLLEMNKRNKAGGILDRRIGENDPTMTPEERALQRFTREKIRRKGASLFDLEEGDGGEQLTHLGRTLSFEIGVDAHDDFDAVNGDILGSDEDGSTKSLKRKRGFPIDDDFQDNPKEDNQLERKKTKAEVMKEVISKSKFHKYERQQAKEEDEDLREALDKGMPDLLAILRGQPKPEKPVVLSVSENRQITINPERAALIEGLNGGQYEKDYDTRVREMAFDKKSKPTERTKTEEEKAALEASRLKELEEKRLRRMRGEDESEDEPAETSHEANAQGDEDIIPDDAAEFGFLNNQHGLRPLGIDDEDDFIIEEDLIADETDVDPEWSEGTSEESDASVEDPIQDIEDAEFIQDIFSEDNGQRIDQYVNNLNSKNTNSSEIAFIYSCPQNHTELLKVLENVPPREVSTVVQRIRALYHPQLHADNKHKLAIFSTVLVNHIYHLGNSGSEVDLCTMESLIRHIHSLSRTYTSEIARAFRSYLEQLHDKPFPQPGDLIILTAVGTIYPTSDHFHQVVTPAITLMGRFLGLTRPDSTEVISSGAVLVALCLKYQNLAQRYIPEAVRFTILSIKFHTISPDLFDVHVKNLVEMSNIWAAKSAFIEIFNPALELLSTIPTQKKHAHQLRLLISKSRLARRPLELHHHRPLAIKTSIPKFEEGFNPNKHYDPDRDRAEASKLKAEYKRERKGAMRELRKDANFIARERLREKKEKDQAYEAKYKKLVAEIQGEEGREKNEYERIKRMRKSKR
ncbi:nucleolar protein 14 [Patellaria atrata CBS 101060]|uniref:Nucleolar protein 14 n=1 Tax=Patellaria atrata CBS 101060 TaxID=1346257 RepID=A0A9P4S3R3_9PEZI|nr:nucleolar protein 14 [Patellaria atrata CBS 101060]